MTDRGAARTRRRLLLVGTTLALLAVLVTVGLLALSRSDRTNPLAARGATGQDGAASVGVGGPLPADEECEARVRHPGDRETRPSNATANATVPQRVSIPPWGDGYDPRIDRTLSRVDGRFTGTTDELLAWGACKWGLDADVVRAMAMEESEWRQSATGDVSQDQEDCVPGASAPCPTSFGILQVRHLYRPGSYPAARESTAFNVDYALGVVRACYEGEVIYLEPDDYRAGDAWGCLGWHYSGEWRDDEARGYIARVEERLREREWTRW